LQYNGTFANFEFTYTNGTVIPAWIEANNSGVLTIWLNITNTTTQVELDIFNSTTNTLSSSGTTGIGEAPQLSSTYAQYDDGASVFNFYDNFAGTSLNTSKWTVGTVTASVNNGLTITGSNSNPAHLMTVATFPQNQYSEEWYGTYATQTSGSWSASGFGFNITGNLGSFPYYSLGVGYGSGSPPSFQGYTGLWSLYETATSGSYGYFYYNYTTLEKTVTAYSGSYSWGWGLQSSDNPYRVQWARMRALPPNGVMPSYSFGAVQSTGATL
ncbi:MAG: hypothetical protein ACP5MB_11535, partial [bacterium]